MKKLSLALVLSAAAALSLSACHPVTDDYIETKDGHYWQRTDAASAIYQRGPKAQQMLHRDIAKCVYQVRELQRLGAIRSATPGDVDINGKTPDATVAAGRLAGQDTPERDGFLYAEQTDFHDFETCMNGNGWDRVEYLPYNISVEARDNYIKTMKEEQRRSKSGGNNTDRVDAQDNAPKDEKAPEQAKYETKINQ
ncbi:MAG: putative lipoprotein [Micavibrio sp.]|nr:putative lipoprotein [Micavibrio sp.]